MNNKKRFLSATFIKKLFHLVRSSLRIQLILAFVFCSLISMLVWLVTSPFFVNEDRRLDFTEGIVTIEGNGRDLVRAFTQMNQDINGLVIQLGDEDRNFKEKFLNRSAPAANESASWLTVPSGKQSVYHLTKNELIQYILDKPAQQNNFKAIITDANGKILYKSKGITDTKVNLEDAKASASKTMVEKNHKVQPTVTRLYPVTLASGNNYLIINGIPTSTVLYDKETGVTPYLLAIITFILCFYLITKRKMKEIEELALGVMEMAKGNLKYRIREKSGDELGSLASHINFMASELNDMIERQRHTEKLKDELITNVSHDLRTPLTSIMGYLRLVKDHQFRNKSQLDEYVDIAYGKSEQLKKLIEDLFDFTRLTHEGVQLKKEKVSLNQMIRQLIDELDPIAGENHVGFTTDLPKVPIMMEVDPNQMVRALENILTNAIQYSTPAGNIQVKMVESNQSVEISVSNPCKSLSKDEVMRLFDRFYRVDTSRSSQKSGAGLGLAITKSIIELHDGTIQADYKNKVIQLTIRLPFHTSKRIV